MPARREAALPLTDPPVVSMNSCTRASEVRLSPLALARRRVCEALPGRPRAGRLRARYALKKGRRELVTVVGFVAVLAVWRLGARPQTADTACWPKAGEKKGRERSATEGRRKGAYAQYSSLEEAQGRPSEATYAPLRPPAQTAPSETQASSRRHASRA
eukprot:scaffold34330_cov48-Phaeocystis_antarctica.AAC.2